MENQKKSLLSIGPDGIKMNVGKGSSIITKGTKTFMRGVEQNVVGGKIKHNPTNELIQVRNKMEATNGGEIINKVEDGILSQVENEMKVSDKGKIINKVSKKKLKFLVILSVLATLASLYLFGEHIWTKFFL